MTGQGWTLCHFGTLQTEEGCLIWGSGYIIWDDYFDWWVIKFGFDNKSKTSVISILNEKNYFIFLLI